MGLFDIFRIKTFKARIAALEHRIDALGVTEYEETKALIERMQADSSQKLADLSAEITSYQNTVSRLTVRVNELTAESEKYAKQCKTAVNKIEKAKELFRAIQAGKERYDTYGGEFLTEEQKALLDELAPTVTLKLHCMDMRDLRKAYRDNEKQITAVVERYKARYTTKANQTIYDLMVIALKAEIQNILYSLKYEKLDVGIDAVKQVTSKYAEIAVNGNQNIANTVVRFIGEIEYLFINAAKIEYNYYVKKEQARQEQLAIREQMRQEAEERKALEQERKRIEAEEQKYKNQIEAITSKLEEASPEEQAALRAELLKVEENLSEVVIKKDDIAKLQHGKAGNVYIISNLGSFGENVFKIGMTRRTDPQDRINELGSASVPFSFDVHSFIFSEDAVSLEAELHKRLNDKRVNKVNMRKEFFYASLDELEELTNEISPSAEFNRTMLAEEYRQSLSSTELYTTDYTPDDEDDD